MNILRKTVDLIKPLSILKSKGIGIACYYNVNKWATPVNFNHIELPEQRKLPLLDRQPVVPLGVRPPKSMKRLMHIRGPELVHNQLIYNQFGIIALSGVQLKTNHVDMIRTVINRHMDEKRMFAVWRIDSPWKARTKKPIGKRMGGGKGSIDHYVTPIKAGRIIVEIGGKAEFKEVEQVLMHVVHRLPCDSMVVSKEILDNLYAEEQRLKETNINPFNFEYMVRNNMQGNHNWIRVNDKEWFDKYI